MSNVYEKIAGVANAEANAFLGGFQTPIEIKIGQCLTYSALLRGEHETPASLDKLLEWAARRGRVIVSGRGASGKSALLYRAARQAADLKFAPFIIPLSRWDQPASEDWKVVRDNPREALDFLLRRFCAGSFDVTDAEFLEADIQKLFLLDGLNETPGSVADEILSACDQVASLMIGACFIVSDRLVRRSINEDKWRFVMPLPVEEEQINRLMSGKTVPPGTEGLLDSPFFLDRAIRGELRGSPLKTIKELVETRGKLDSTSLIVASEAAFHAYEIDGSRTFDAVRFAELGREDILETLAAGGILVRLGDNRVTFFHHWYHDYLASKYVAADRELWDFDSRHRTLDALTFRANSFDAIAFVLELLPVADSGLFIQAVYDWNPYAAGYALAEANISVNDIPKDVRLVILAMLAEKRFDRHFYSALRAEDALDLLGDRDATAMRSTGSLEELLQSIEKIEAPSEEFAAWQRFFVMRAGSKASSELIGALSNDNSMIGWTAANVVKRLQLDANQITEIEATAGNNHPVVRWRAVHVMGGFANETFVSSLFHQLDSDANENVRYGALRSLIEVASRDEKILPKIVDGIIERLDVLVKAPRILGELSRAVFLAKGCAPPTWSQQISRVFYGLLDRADSSAAVEQWSKISSRLRIHHRPEPQLAA
jgi:hypothetical protein